MKSYSVRIDRRPKVKARPRHTKKGHVFTPKETLIEEDYVAEAWQEQIGKQIEGPVEVIVAYSPTCTLLTSQVSHGRRASTKWATTPKQHLNETAKNGAVTEYSVPRSPYTGFHYQ